MDWSEIASQFEDVPWQRAPGVRVTNLGPEVRWWSRATGQQRSWWSLCEYCADPLEDGPHVHDRLLQPQGRGEPQGSAGRGVRPQPYTFDDDETCIHCGVRLH